jgi:hypothetical protein
VSLPSLFFVRRLIDCFYTLCLSISLPLAIWLSSGWIGLFVNWIGLFVNYQAFSGVARLLEKATPNAQAVLQGSLARAEFSQGETSCTGVKSEAR